LSDEIAVPPHEIPEPLGWDEVAAIGILLMATANVRGVVAVPSPGFVLYNVLWVLAYLAVSARLVQRFGTEWLTWTLRQQPALWLLLIVAFASTLWSLAPSLTILKAAELLGTTVLGVFIGYACSPQQLIRVLHWTFAVVILTSILVAVTLPAPVLGPHTPPGWRGIMSHKNSFGALAAFATIFFLIMTVLDRVPRLWGAMLCVSYLSAVVLARSQAAAMALAVSLVAGAYLAVARVTQRPIQPVMRRAALVLVLVVALLPVLVAPLAEPLGRNDPLNGRLALWDGSRQIMRERPWTGYGYEVVWGRSRAQLLPHISVVANPSAASAHNSILSIATELGIPAAIVACAYLFGALSNAGRLFEREPSAFSFFALVFLIAFTVRSFAEANLLEIHSIFWILFVALTVAVERALDRGANGPQVAHART